MLKEYYLGTNQQLDIFFVMEYNIKEKQEKIYKIFYNKQKCKKYIEYINKKIMEKIIE
jgi:hypothetical protein